MTEATALRWGILATGWIAGAFTSDLLEHGHTVTAVGSRSLESATAFASRFGIPTAHDSYDGLANDPSVDIVYVATPHNLHFENAKVALEHGKHVLVEKAFMMTEAEAAEITALAAERGLVAMEAMWTRFLPHMHFVHETIRAGRIGEILSVHAEHSQSLPTDPAHRLNDPHRAGGALLDLGIYPISFASDILGPAESIKATATFGPNGVDESVATIMQHARGAISTSYSTMRAAGRNTASIHGTTGRIDTGAVWFTPAPVSVVDLKGTVLDAYDVPVTGRGMQFQAAEVERLVRARETSGTLMSTAESVRIMGMMDAVRAEIGLRYPGE